MGATALFVRFALLLVIALLTLLAAEVALASIDLGCRQRRSDRRLTLRLALRLVLRLIRKAGCERCLLYTSPSPRD